MTAIPSTEEFWGVDSYLAYAFPLDTSGFLLATSTAVYSGLEIDGTRNFALAPAQGTTVVNVGNGRLRDSIYRAPREASRAELTIGYTQAALKAALSNVKTYSVGEMLGIGRLTNQQGSEPDISLMVTQRGHNENGLTRYLTYAIPRSRVIPRDSPMTENASEETFDVTMSNSRYQIWGLPYTVAIHGVTDATYEAFVSEGVARIAAWKANGSEVAFDFDADFPAISTAKIAVYNSFTNTAITANLTKAVDGIEFDYPPSDGTIIVAVYEYAP
jgi:hypothetical protein